MCPEAGKSYPYNTYGFHSPIPEVQSRLSPAFSSTWLFFSVLWLLMSLVFGLLF